MRVSKNRNAQTDKLIDKPSKVPPVALANNSFLRPACTNFVLVIYNCCPQESIL